MDSCNGSKPEMEVLWWHGGIGLSLYVEISCLVPLGPDISENRPLGNVSYTPLVPDGRGADTLLVRTVPLLLGRERIVQGECSAVHIPRDT
jgi:hypothetical protein